MGNNSVIKLVIIILIPVGIFFGKGTLQDMLSSNEELFVDLTPMKTIDKSVQENSPSVDILKQYSARYIDYNVFTGVDTRKINSYFAPKVPEIKPEDVKQPVVNNVVINTPVYRNKPIYKIDLVFVGSDERYISLGSKLLSIGDRTPQGEVIKNIESNRIQLQGKWGLRWVSVNY